MHFGIVGFLDYEENLSLFFLFLFFFINIKLNLYL